MKNTTYLCQRGETALSARCHLVATLFLLVVLRQKRCGHRTATIRLFAPNFSDKATADFDFEQPFARKQIEMLSRDGLGMRMSVPHACRFNFYHFQARMLKPLVSIPSVSLKHCQSWPYETHLTSSTVIGLLCWKVNQ